MPFSFCRDLDWYSMWNTVNLDVSAPKKSPFLSNLKSSMTTGHPQLLAPPPSEAGGDRDLIPLNAVYSQHHLRPRHCARDSQRISRKGTNTLCFPIFVPFLLMLPATQAFFSFHQSKPSDVTFLRNLPYSPTINNVFLTQTPLFKHLSHFNLYVTWHWR